MSDIVQTPFHTAPGQMAGYLFQPDRALVLLCKCKNNESVSIELVDDLAIVDEEDNVIYREQDKSSIKINGQTFKDRSKDLWNTLMIWITDLKKGSLSIDTTILLCVTNKKVDDKALIKKIALAEKEADVNSVITLLKSAAKKPPIGIKDIMAQVLAEEDILRKLIPKINLSDDSGFEKRNEEIAHELHLTDEIKENVITDLRGWLQEVILLQLDQGKSPIIKKTDFNNRFQKAIKKETDNRIKVLAKRFVKSKITKERLDEASDSIFVKQLEMIEHPQKDDIIVDAIDDFLCSETERIRLILIGDLTKPEFEAIDDSSKERWKESFRRKITLLKPSMSESDLAKLAYEIYDNTIDNYLSKIRGQDTELYFTKGSFHKLSDELEIGWHPHWEKIFSNE